MLAPPLPGHSMLDSSPQAPSTPSVPVIPTNSTETATNNAPSGALVGCLTIALALSLTLMALGYKRYRACQRSRLLQRQIAMLEAMWRISSRR